MVMLGLLAAGCGQKAAPSSVGEEGGAKKAAASPGESAKAAPKQGAVGDAVAKGEAGQAPGAAKADGAAPTDPSLPEHFKPMELKAAVEGGAPTGAEAATVKVGPWTLSHSLAEGKAVHGESKEELVLWRQDPRGCQGYEAEGQLISVVGSVVSFQFKELGKSCQGAAVAGQEFRTVDLSKAGADKGLSLTDVFDAAEVKAAFDGNGWLKQARTKPQIFKCLYKEEDLTGAHFAFLAMEGEKVKVRVGVGHGCEDRAGIFTQFDLSLTPPAGKKSELEAAVAAKTLGQHLHKTAAGRP